MEKDNNAENRLIVARAGLGGTRAKQVRGSKIQISSYKMSKSMDVMYSMVSKVNNTVLNICKFLREQILKVPITRKRNGNYVW